MEAKKDWESLMEIVRIMHRTGYSTMMNNHKRWEIYYNDNCLLNCLPEYNEEIRGSKLSISNYTNLDCFHRLIQEFIDWSLENIKPYEDFVTEEIIDFHTEIKEYCK